VEPILLRGLRIARKRLKFIDNFTSQMRRKPMNQIVFGFRRIARRQLAWSVLRKNRGVGSG
jgi:hypothetical protein